MIAESISPITSGPAARLVLALLATCCCPRAAGAAPFTVQGPRVNSSDFRITTFASNLDFPLGMAKLSDGSLLVALSQGANFFNSTGKLFRFVDTDQDGVADGAGIELYSNLTGSQSAVRVGGNL